MKYKHIFDITNFELQKDIFLSKDRVLLIYGGAGSGKSTSAIDKIIIESVIAEQNKNKLKVLIIRKTMPSLRKTSIPLLEERCEVFGLRHELNNIRMEAVIGNNTQVLFISVNDRAAIAKLKSISNVDIILIEEADEITLQAYQQLLVRLRGGKHSLTQLMLVCNPNASSWIYNYFVVEKNDNVKTIQINWEKNKWCDKENLKTIEAFKHTNLSNYKSLYLGEWSKPEGLIFPNIQFVDIHIDILRRTAKMSLTSKLLSYKEIIVGIDFGFTDPSVALFMGVSKVSPMNIEFHVLEEVYEVGLTNIEFINKIKEKLSTIDSKGVKYFCDTAEPDRIAEFRQCGLNAYEADKSVLMGIDSVQKSTVYVDTCCSKAIKDFKMYSWDIGGDGQMKNQPCHTGSHAPDALRYAIHTYLKGMINKPKIYVR